MKLTEKLKQARGMVCMPLDGLPTMDAVENRVKELSPVVGLFKIGKETYTRFGSDSVRMVQEYGANVFLDLKYHDIPNTVRGAANAAAQLGIYMFNVHASGGQEMMQVAVEGAREGSIQYGTVIPKITAVTVLTSLDDLRYVQNALPIIKKLPVESQYEDVRNGLCNFPFLRAIDADIFIREEKDKSRKVKLQKKFLKEYGDPFDSLLRKLNLDNIVPDSVLNYAQMAHEANLDGIVCSAADLYAVKNKMPHYFIFVTPGIKGPNTPAGKDQKRVFTPGNAVQDGSNIMVIGRTITEQKHQKQEFKLA